MAVYREAKTIYFQNPGAENTADTLAAAFDRAIELGLGHVVVASSSGQTGLKALKQARAKGYQGKVVVVGHHYGYDGPGMQKMTGETRQELESNGAQVFIGTHILASITRSFRLKWQGIGMLEVVAETLRRVSTGAKVCVEISIMAADAGLIPVDQDIVAVAGRAGGADTALVIRPANMNSFFDLKFKEIIAMSQLDDEKKS
jgi:hypothetical protein